MATKAIDLSELDNQPIEIRKAIAFYAAQGILPIHYSVKERNQHYKTLENAGLIEPISVVNL